MSDSNNFSVAIYFPVLFFILTSTFDLPVCFPNDLLTITAAWYYILSVLVLFCLELTPTRSDYQYQKLWRNMLVWMIMFVKENYQSRNWIHLLHLCFTQFWKAFFTFHFGGTTVRSPSFVCYQQSFIEIEVYDISHQNNPHLNDHHLLESCFFLQGTLCPLLWQEIFMRTLERKTWKKSLLSSSQPRKRLR